MVKLLLSGLDDREAGSYRIPDIPLGRSRFRPVAGQDTISSTEEPRKHVSRFSGSIRDILLKFRYRDSTFTATDSVSHGQRIQRLLWDILSPKVILA